MAFLFDTDAISEVMRKRPLPAYLEWLRRLPRGEQFTSAINVGELYKGAYRSPAAEVWLERLQEQILPTLTVLPYDVGTAKLYGRLRADLELRGTVPGEADIQIAATALQHNLVMVTGNLKHYSRIEGLEIETILADARASSRG